MTILLALLLSFPAAPQAPAPAPAPDDEQPTSSQDAPARETPAERARRERMERLRASGEREAAVGMDGEPLKPGVLPKDASPEARALWLAVREALLAPEPVRAFDISFYIRQRQASPQNNDAEARIQFLLPDNVRSVLTKSGRALMRGPAGDYLLDDREIVKLVGREGVEDKRQLDEVVGIARNFIALTDPSSVRVAALSVADGAPSGLPPHLLARAAKLQWLAVVSPDFRLYQTPPRERGAPPPLFRALLGVDPETKRVELALIHEAGGVQTLLQTTLLVHLTKLRQDDGYVVPGKVDVYQVATEVQPLAFRRQPTSELWIREKGVELRPSLEPIDFVPPR